jgi:F0F1-type ATP synthase assembly protein I
MSEESKAALIKKLSIRNGLIIAGVVIVLSLVFWVVDPLLQYTNTWVSMLNFVIVIALLVVLGLETRKVVGGYWTFGEAFKSLLLMSVIISVLTVLFHYILNAFIDPTLPDRVSEALIAKLNDQFSSSGMSQERIDEFTKSMDGKFAATPKNEAVNLGIGLLVYAIIDLIIAAIIKKNPPMFAPIDETETDPTV